MGGTPVLAETPEIYGAEHLLTRRAINRAVGEKLVERIRWWEEYTKRNNGEMNNNPSPGNKAGGLTTILEKSLGAAAKGGTTSLRAVYEYAQPIKEKGLRVHGYAGLRPGRGHRPGGGRLERDVLHHRPRLRLRLQADALDQARDQYRNVQAHARRHGHQLRRRARRRLDRAEGRGDFQKVLAVASGEHTKSEDLGYGDLEFVPWQVGAVM
jgi:altronate hydrolase